MDNKKRKRNKFFHDAKSKGNGNMTATLGFVKCH